MTANDNALHHTDAASIELPHLPIEPAQCVDGDDSVTTGHFELGTLNGCNVGIWEMSVGIMADIETDEFFIVLSGRGTVDVLPENGFAQQTQLLTPGSVVRLIAGMHTVWQVDEPLRKVYVTPSDAEDTTVT